MDKVNKAFHLKGLIYWGSELVQCSAIFELREIPH